MKKADMSYVGLTIATTRTPFTIDNEYMRQLFHCLRWYAGIKWKGWTCWSVPSCSYRGHPQKRYQDSPIATIQACPIDPTTCSHGHIFWSGQHLIWPPSLKINLILWSSRVPTFLPRWNSLTFPWLLKWDSRYPVNSKNGTFWKINVMFYYRLLHPYTDSMPFPVFFSIFLFFQFFSFFFKIFLLYFVIYRISHFFFISCSFIYFAFFLLFFFFPDSIQNSLTFPWLSLTTQIPWLSLTLPDFPGWWEPCHLFLLFGLWH